MGRAFYLGVLLIATSLAPQHGLTSRRPELVAECTFTPGDVDRIVADLADTDARESIETRLAEHALEHGWARRFYEPDFVDAHHSAPCPQAVLDRMAAFKDHVHNWDCMKVCESFAVALERSGQLDRALELLDSAISEYQRDLPKDMFASFVGYPSSELAHDAAVLCEREGRIDRALEYANRWVPTSSCGTCDRFELTRIKYFRASLLVKLKRFDEAMAIVRDSETYLKKYWMCLWIDCEIGSGRCKDSKSALRVVRDASKDWKSAPCVSCVASSADSKVVEACELGKRLWDLRHSPRRVQIDNLSQLAFLDEDFALPLALSLDEQGLRDHMDAFDVVESHLRDEELAEVLAYTGAPELEAPIERAEKQLCGDAIEFIRKRWDASNRQIAALTHKR